MTTPAIRYAQRIRKRSPHCRCSVHHPAWPVDVHGRNIRWCFPLWHPLHFGHICFPSIFKESNDFQTGLPPAHVYRYSNISCCCFRDPVFYSGECPCLNPLPHAIPSKRTWYCTHNTLQLIPGGDCGTNGWTHGPYNIPIVTLRQVLTSITSGMEVFHGPAGLRTHPIAMGKYILDISGLSLGCPNWWEIHNLKLEGAHNLTWLLATGIAASIVNRGPIYDILGTTAYGANTALNLYATCFITIRLLVHRRLVKTRLGNNEAVTAHHLHIIGILLESAAINVPVAIVAAVGMGTGRAFIETVLTPTICASQVCWSKPGSLSCFCSPFFLGISNCPNHPSSSSW